MLLGPRAVCGQTRSFATNGIVSIYLSRLNQSQQISFHFFILSLLERFYQNPEEPNWVGPIILFVFRPMMEPSQFLL